MDAKSIAARGARGQRGVVIIWLALFLLSILGFMALGIDMAKLMATRTQLQNAADAAALAGASAIDPATGAIRPDTAVARAQEICGRNKAFIAGSEPVALAAGDVTFPAPNECRVTVRRQGESSIVTHMAQVLGIRRLEMTATATAKLDTARSVLCGIVPLAAAPDSGQTFLPGCLPGYVLKLPGGSGASGNYLPIRLPNCPTGDCAGMPPGGANTFRCWVRYGYCCEVTEGQVVSTEPGNMAGPMTQAIRDRFRADTDGRPNICYSEYTGNGQRVVIVPMTTQPVGGGVENVTVSGFGAFFLKDVPSPGNENALIGEFVYVLVPGEPGGSGGGAVTFALRLIR